MGSYFIRCSLVIFCLCKKVLGPSLIWSERVYQGISFSCPCFFSSVIFVSYIIIIFICPRYCCGCLYRGDQSFCFVGVTFYFFCHSYHSNPRFYFSLFLLESTAIKPKRRFFPVLLLFCPNPNLQEQHCGHSFRSKGAWKRGSDRPATQPTLLQLWSYKVRRMTFINWHEFRQSPDPEFLKLWKGWSG